jgi:hypothetical protein
MSRTNFAPTLRTIVIAIVLIIVGVIGTFGPWLPDQIGIGAFVAATVLLLLGMLFRGI